MASLFPKLATPPADIASIIKSLQGIRNTEELARNGGASTVIGQAIKLVSHLGLSAKKSSKPRFAKRVKGDAVHGSAGEHSFEAVIGKVGGKPTISQIMVWKGEANPGNLVASFSKGAMLKGEADPLSALMAEFSKQYPQLSAPLSKQGEEDDAEMAESEAEETGAAEGEAGEGEAASDGDTIHAVIFALAEMLATAGDPLATQVLAAYDAGEDDEPAEEEASEDAESEPAEFEGQDDDVAEGEVEEEDEPMKAARAEMRKAARCKCPGCAEHSGKCTQSVKYVVFEGDDPEERGVPMCGYCAVLAEKEEGANIFPYGKSARPTMRKGLIDEGQNALKSLVAAQKLLGQADQYLSGNPEFRPVQVQAEAARTAIVRARMEVDKVLGAKKGARPGMLKGLVDGGHAAAKALIDATSSIARAQSQISGEDMPPEINQNLETARSAIQAARTAILSQVDARKGARPQTRKGANMTRSVLRGTVRMAKAQTGNAMALAQAFYKKYKRTLLGRDAATLKDGIDNSDMSYVAYAMGSILRDPSYKDQKAGDGKLLSDAQALLSATGTQSKAARPGMRKGGYLLEETIDSMSQLDGIEGPIRRNLLPSNYRRVIQDGGKVEFKILSDVSQEGDTPATDIFTYNIEAFDRSGKSVAEDSGGLRRAVVEKIPGVNIAVKAARPGMRKAKQDEIVRGSLEVVETSNGYELYGTSPDGKEVHIASLGDGVDMFMDEDGESLSPGTPEFDKALKNWIKTDSEIADAYDFTYAKAARAATRKAARPARRVAKASDGDGDGEFNEDGYYKDGETVVIDPDADMDDVAYSLVLEGWEDERADEASDMGWSYSLVVADFRVGDDEYGGFIYGENKNSGNKVVDWFDTADEARAKWSEVEADVASEDGQMIRDNNHSISKEFESWFEKHPGSDPQDAVDALEDRIGDDYGTGTSDSAVAAMLEIATEVYDEGGYAAGASEEDDGGDIEAAARIGSLRKMAATEPAPAVRQAYEAEIARLEDGVAVQKSGGPDVRVRKFAGLAVGDEVMHKSYGPGRIMALETGQSAKQVSVIFSDPNKGNILGPINIDPNKLQRGK